MPPLIGLCVCVPRPVKESVSFADFAPGNARADWTGSFSPGIIQKELERAEFMSWEDIENNKSETTVSCNYNYLQLKNIFVEIIIYV